MSVEQKKTQTITITCDGCNRGHVETKLPVHRSPKLPPNWRTVGFYVDRSEPVLKHGMVWSVASKNSNTTTQATLCPECVRILADLISGYFAPRLVPPALIEDS